MDFKCISHHNGKTDSWNGRIVYFKDCSNCIEMNIQSRSSLDVIIGTTKYGNYVCIHQMRIRGKKRYSFFTMMIGINIHLDARMKI